MWPVMLNRSSDCCRIFLRALTSKKQWGFSRTDIICGKFRLNLVLADVVEHSVKFLVLQFVYRCDWNPLMPNPIRLTKPVTWRPCLHKNSKILYFNSNTGRWRSEQLWGGGGVNYNLTDEGWGSANWHIIKISAKWSWLTLVKLN